MSRPPVAYALAALVAAPAFAASPPAVEAEHGMVVAAEARAAAIGAEWLGRSLTPAQDNAPEARRADANPSEGD